MQECLNELSVYQHGFRKHMSCTTQLACVTHDLRNNFDRIIPTHAAVLDFSKAFDIVPHNKLIQKLVGCNVNPLLVRWISSFLSNRFQQVIAKRCKSKPAAVTSGVPQGSVLGPALFSVFINDIVNSVKYCNIRLFADDTILYTEVTKTRDAHKLQHDLNMLHIWSLDNGMRYNATNSNVIIFGNNESLIRYDYILGGVPLKQGKSIKYLKIYLTSNLKRDMHIEYTTQKAMKVLGLIKYPLHDAPEKNQTFGIQHTMQTYIRVRIRGLGSFI